MSATHRDRLIFAIGETEDARAIEPGWYVNGDPGGEPDLGANYCRQHAEQVARFEALEARPDVHVWADTTHGHQRTDAARRCEFGGCRKPLDFGGLTSEGVDDALGIGMGPNPHALHVYPAELELAAQSMAPDDKRWPLWEAHATKLLRRLKRAAARAAAKALAA